MKSLEQNTKDLRMQLALLAQIEPTDVNFLTCHLDTRGGRLQAQASFRKMQLSYRQTLSERNKIDFDHAAKMVEVFLESFEAKSDSIMIYCRGILGGQYFLTIPVLEPLDNKIIFRSTPSITTLASLIKQQHDKNVTKHLPVTLHLEEDMHDVNQGLLMNRHLERDENSYSLEHDEQRWPAGAPVALQGKKQIMLVNSLDLVA